MSPKAFPKPPIASFSLRKTLFLGTGMSMLFTFLIWLFRHLESWATKRDFTMAFVDVVGGIFLLPLSLYSRWAWQPRRRYALWHRWSVNLMGSVYLSILLLLAARMFWEIVLGDSRAFVVNLILTGLFVFAWLLPVISYPLAKQLEDAQYALDWRILKWGGLALVGVAGVIGANIGLHGGDKRFVLLAVLFSATATGSAQYFASYLWPYRPWAKEEE
jgi:hypothetical protein